MNQVVAEDGVDQGERIERIGGEVGHEVVLAGDVHRRHRSGDRRVGGCRTVEGHPKHGLVAAGEALQDAAVGPVRVGDEHEAHRGVRRVGDEGGLLIGGDGGALREPQDGVVGVGERLACGRRIRRFGHDAGRPAQAVVEVGHPGRHGLVEVQIAKAGEGKQLLGGVDGHRRAVGVIAAAQPGRRDVERVHGADVEADELGGLLRDTEFVEGGTHVERRRGEHRSGLGAGQRGRSGHRGERDRGVTPLHGTPFRLLQRTRAPIPES